MKIERESDIDQMVEILSKSYVHWINEYRFWFSSAMTACVKDGLKVANSHCWIHIFNSTSDRPILLIRPLCDGRIYWTENVDDQSLGLEDLQGNHISQLSPDSMHTIITARRRS